MIKIILTVAVLGSVGNLAGFAMAESKQDQAFVTEIVSLPVEHEAQCAHRRIMPPDAHDNCVNKTRSDAQVGYGQAGAAAEAAGIGPGGGGGRGNGIGPGGGGGQGKGRQ